MTLSEKQEKQKEIIDELFSSLIEHNISIKEHTSFFINKITDLFHIEMDYYHIKYPELATIRFGKIEYCDLYGQFVIDAEVTEDWQLILNPPRIDIRKSDIVDLCSIEKVEDRLEACNQLIHTLFHEMTHLRKYLMQVQSVSDYNALKNAKEFILNGDSWKLGAYNTILLSSEAEADYVAYSELENFVELPDKSKIFKKINQSDIKTAFLLVPSQGIVDRDEYVDREIEKVLLSDIGPCWLIHLRILLKEFNGKRRPRRLWDLIERYRIELTQVDLSNKPDNEKKILLDGINGLYFELFNKRLLKNIKFEFYEALLHEGVGNVEFILTLLKWYNAQEKNRKTLLIKEKLDTIYNADIFIHNSGFIVDPQKGYKDVISTEDFMNSIEIKTDNKELLEYFHSEKFRFLLPLFGFYVLKSGLKISIEDFINGYAIPELEKKKPINYHAKYEDLLFDKCFHAEEVEAQYNLQNVNKRYQTLDNIITELLHSRIFDSKKQPNIMKSYGPDLIRAMELVVNICNGDESFFNEFGTVPYDEAQVFLYAELKQVALLLSSDETFNPTKINYYEILVKNEKFNNLGKDIVNYVKMISEKGGIKR